MKKIASLLLVILLVVFMPYSAFAEENEAASDKEELTITGIGEESDGKDTQVVEDDYDPADSTDVLEPKENNTIVDSGTIDNISWEFYSDGTLYITGEGRMPDESSPWVYHLENITSLVIEDGITSIGRGVFFNCSRLKTISIPDSVTCIEAHAFTSCTQLSSLSIPGSVKRIEDYAFSNCSKLKSIHLGEGVIYVGDYAFDRDSALEEIYIPSTVEYLGRRLNYGSLDGIGYLVGGIHNKLYYGGTLEEFFNITNNEFAIGDLYINQKIVTTISLPENTINIKDNAFYGLTSLKTIVIPEGTKSIGYGAFYYCRRLKDVSIPDSVNSIGERAFEQCEELQTVTLPYSLQTINSQTFRNCIKLQSLDIPESVSFVGSYAFCDCNASISITNGIIPEDWAFYNAHVDSVKIADGVTSLPSGVFARSSYSPGYVKKVELPKSLEIIESRAFDQASDFGVNGEELVLPKNLKTIEERAFNVVGCNYDRIVIPENVTYIGDNAFNSNTVVKIECPPLSEMTSGLSDCQTIYYPCSIWTEDDRNAWSIDADWILVHDYAVDTIIKQPTCTEGGSQRVRCTACGDIITEETPALGHEWNNEPTIDKAATCTEEGSQSIHCIRCNETKDAITISAKGHTEELRNAAEATCTTAGYTGDKYCSDCGELLEQGSAIAALGHNKVSVKAVAATCQATGMKAHYECERCGTFLDKNGKVLSASAKKKLVVKKKAHSYKKKITTEEYLKSAATCTKKATYFYACSMCDLKGKKTYTVGKALGHSYENVLTPATTSKDGSIVKKCTRCGKKAKTTKIYKASKVTIDKKYQSVAYKGDNLETTTVSVKTSKKKAISKDFYDLTFDNSYETGIGTVTITFRGNYSGTKTLTYKIKGIPEPQPEIQEAEAGE